MAFLTITQTGSHIIIVDSRGTDHEVSIPKQNLTVLKRTSTLESGTGVEYVFLNWPAGSGGGGAKALPKSFARDWYKLKYDDVTSPTVADNDALVALLLAYAANVYNIYFTSNYTGKITGGNGDFDVSYNGGTTIDIDTFPSEIAAFVAADIGLIRQINSAGVWVADYNPANSTITIAGSRITVAEAAFALTDVFIVYTTVARSNTEKIAVGWYGHDLIADVLYHIGECKSIQVIVAATFTTLTDNGDNPTTGMVGPALPAGTFISANGKFTEITLAGGTILAIRGDYDDTFATTSTTSTSTTS